MLPMYHGRWQDRFVTMPLHDDEAPRLAEIGRRVTEVSMQLSDFRSEFRIMVADMVRKETYNAERAADRERIQALEQNSRSLRNLVYSCMGTIIVSIVLYLLLGKAV